MDSFRHFGDAHIEARGRRPSRPVPVPQDLKVEFIDAFWRSDGWHRATWLGKAVHRAPTDLFVYQELVWRVKPDWVIETRTGTGGRALFLASICDLVGSGQIVSIDRYPVGDVPEHPRITHLRADPTTDAAAAKVSELLGADSRALVILGGTSGSEVVRAFQRYSPFVPIGSYVVVEDTIFGGNPVWPHFGPGPASAVNDIVDERRFVPDPALEHLALTFNIGGFLRRIR